MFENKRVYEVNISKRGKVSLLRRSSGSSGSELAAAPCEVAEDTGMEEGVGLQSRTEIHISVMTDYLGCLDFL